MRGARGARGAAARGGRLKRRAKREDDARALDVDDDSRARARVALVSALFATFAIVGAVGTSAIPAATAVVIENVAVSNDGERVTLDATMRGTTLSLTLRRDSESAAGARIQAWGGEDGTGSVDGDEDENARLEALRRCSYGGEATDAQGRTLRAFGTVCHG